MQEATKAVTRPLTVVLPERYDGSVEVADATGSVVQQFAGGLSATSAYAIATQANNAGTDEEAGAVLALWDDAAAWTGIVGHQRETVHARHRAERTGEAIPVTGEAVWETHPERHVVDYERGARVYVQAQGAWRRGVVLSTTPSKVVVIYRNLNRETGYVKAQSAKLVRLSREGSA